MKRQSNTKKRKNTRKTKFEPLKFAVGSISMSIIMLAILNPGHARADAKKSNVEKALYCQTINITTDTNTTSTTTEQKVSMSIQELPSSHILGAASVRGIKNKIRKKPVFTDSSDDYDMGHP